VRASPREVEVRQSARAVTVTVPTPTLRYLDEFLGLKCRDDLLRLGLFPNAKEITESLAAYHAVKRTLGDVRDLGDPRRTAVVVGDGCTPRTAAVLAFRTRWRVYSVDPQLRKYEGWAGVERLTVVPFRVEDWSLTLDGPAVVVAVHSHASLGEAVLRVRAPELAVIAIPCCAPQEVGSLPDLEYRDWGVWSEKRTVRVWRHVAAL